MPTIVDTSEDLKAALVGVANRLAMIGTANAFAQSNEDIDRAPKGAFFTG
jgi:hypothetical protein